MPRYLKPWEELTPRHRKRLESHGITKESRLAGASLTVARGHGKTPEHPTGNISRKKYPEYVNKRAALMRRFMERKKELWSDRPAWSEERSDRNVRAGTPSIRMLQWALDAEEDELIDALRTSPEEFRW